MNADCSACIMVSGAKRLPTAVVIISVKMFVQSGLVCKTCPEGWSFNHSCYLLSERSGSWDAARMDCRNRGADLLVINSPEEQKFLSTITTEVWIGLNDKEQEGTWRWVDGTPQILMNWGRDQPDNGGEEDCVHLGGDKQKSWNDLWCSSSHQWICEKVS
uniref:C-type lectin domain-containing protein n=1 Tax=Maylandia zebra TaxID=106582 RepID=A0A3P9DJE8_9CICH